MSFLAPIMLVGLAGVAAPIIIHLLDRSRNVPQDFPTLRFLLAAQQETARRSKLRHLLVLLCRCLLIALIVLAMAQPFTQDETWARPPELPTTLVVVLDNSYSMGYREGADGTTRFERAKQIALEQVNALSADDEVALVLAGDRAVTVTDRPTRDHQRVAEMIRAAPLSSTPGEMSPALSAAFGLAQLDANDDAEGDAAEDADDVNNDDDDSTAQARDRREAWRQVMVISDMQRSAWQRVANDDVIADAERVVPVTFYDLSSPTASNRFIRQLDLREDPAAGMFNVALEVVGHGPSRARGGQASLFLSENDEARRAAPPELLPPTAQAEVNLRAELPEPGVHAGSARLEADRLSIDDRAHFAIRVAGGRKLFVVDGEPSPVPGMAGTYYLNTALEIRQARAARPLQIEQRTPQQLATQPLPDSGGALILANVAQLDGSALANVEDFLRAGGNVLVTLGDQVNVEHYNDDWRFMPIRLTGRRGDPARSVAFALQVQDAEHPVFSEGISLAATRFFAFIGADPETLHDEGEVLARFADGSPALVEGRFGSDEGGGRVLVLTGPMDSSWSNFPFRRAFVPFVDRVVSYLTRQRIAAQQVTLGQPVTFEGPARLDGQPIVITRPDGTRQTLRAALDDAGEQAVAVYRQTNEPGVYRVQADPAFGAGGAFAVNVDTRGSILTPIEPDTLRDAFGDEPMRIIQRGAASAGGWHADDEPTLQDYRYEWWPWLLLAALGVFVIETLLANIYTRRPAVEPPSTTQYQETRRTDVWSGHGVEV